MSTIQPTRRIAWQLPTLLAILMTIICTPLPTRAASSNASNELHNPAAPTAAFTVFLPSIQSAPSPTAPRTTYDVTYNDNTVVLDDATVASSLLAISDDQTTLRFRAATPSIATLQPGQVLLVSGVALRKVTHVASENNELVVQTTDATLPDAIQEGTVGIAQSVQWDKVSQADFPTQITGADGAVLHRVDSSPVLAASEIGFTGNIQGWEVTLKLQPVPGRLNITLKATQTVGAAKAAISGVGWVSDFSQSTNMRFDKGTASFVDVRTIDVQGEMELKWSAIAPNGELNSTVSFVIPAEIPIPTRIGPIPATLKLKASLQIVPVMLVSQASSGGSFKATYSSDQGFSVQANTLVPDGQLKDSTLGVSGETVSAGFGPVGFGVGLEFPRIELAFFGNTQVFITTKAFANGFFGTDPPCQKGGMTLLAVTGYKLNFFGFNISDGQQELWRKEFTKFKDDKPC